MNGAIQWSDLSFVFAALALIAGALWFLWSRIDAVRVACERKIEAARAELSDRIEGAREQALARTEAVRVDITKRVEDLRDELVTVRLEMAREYASTAAVTAVEERLTDTLEKLGDKLDALVREVVAKRGP